MSKDLFGKAILDYQQGNYSEDLVTETSISEEDELSLPYLFRSYDEMPKIERTALDLSFGNVLDVGCGAGSHSLFLQHEKGLHVTSIDISENAIKACSLRGLKDARFQDLLRLEGEVFDTILLLMNGAGMCGKLENIPDFLQQLKTLLKPKGQILLDSSDIIYMFDDTEDGGKLIPADVPYYGEVIFTVKYKGEVDEPFNWLYIDYNTLRSAAMANGLDCELVQEGEHYDYLAKLTIL